MIKKLREYLFTQELSDTWLARPAGAIRRAINHVRYELEWIKKVFIYGKFARHDYDFDYNSLLRLISLKLELMEKTFKENGFTTSSKKHAKQMAKANKHLKRLIEDDYISPTLKKYCEKYPWKSRVKDVTNDAGQVIAHEIEPMPITAKQRAKIDSEEKKMLQKKADDEEAFFKIFKEDFREWWD